MTDTGTYIFPSQVYLDDDLRERALASSEMKLLLDLAGDTLDMDFRAILRNGTQDEANDPRFRRPLVNMMGIAGFQYEQRRRGLDVVCVTGISLGCLTAATAAGWLSLEDMVRMSNLMATIEIEIFDDTDYSCVFFYNCDRTRVYDELRSAGVADLLQMSVVVSSNQFIAACRESDLDAMKPALVKAGALYKVIPYSFPGHCGLMDEVQRRFEHEWSFTDPMQNARIPVISLNDARPYTSAEEIWSFAKDQYTTVLDWTDVLRYLQGLELDRCVVLEPSDFVMKSMALDPTCTLTAVAGGVQRVSR